ncbi:hypothetical protein Tco_1102279 [Tanacetum coccineum]
MTTLAEHIIVAGAENRPPMLEKSMCDSWAIRKDGQTRPKKYSKLTEAQQLQDDYDVQAINIILHGVPHDVYALVNHQEIAKDFWDRVKLLMKGTELSYQEHECRLYNLFDKFTSVQGETLYEYYWRFSQLISDMHTIRMIMQQVQVNTKVLNALPPEWSKFVTDVKLAKSLYTTNYDQLIRLTASKKKWHSNLLWHQGFHLQTINSERLPIPEIRQPFKMEESQFNKFKKDKLRVLLALETEELLQPQGETMQLVKPWNSRSSSCSADNPHNLAFHTKDLDANDSDCDDISLAKAVLMANLSSCDSDVLSEVPYSNTYLNDMINQDVQEMSYSEQTHIFDFLDNEITIDSNIIPYSQYLHESQDAVIQDTNSSAPNDLLVLSLVEQMTDHVDNLDKENQINKMEHDVISVIDDEETLILEEESRSKMLDKQNDPISIKQKINISLIDYSKLNKIKEDFDKHFVTQKELSAEQAFWLKHSNYNPDTSIKSHTPVRIEAPSELPKVVKKRTTSDAISAVYKLETELLKKKDLIEKDIYDKLLKSYSTLEKDCISLELRTQLNQEIFQKDNFRENQNAPTFNQLFKINELKAQSQEKDTVIIKLKDRIKSLSGKDSMENVKKAFDEIETINIELEHSVAKLLSENENLRKEREHLKLIYKEQFDSIKKTHVHSKEHCDSLIARINAKSIENPDLNAQLQEKVFAIAALKNELRKLKGKNVIDTAVLKPIATIAPGMFKLDIEPISHRLKNNRVAHELESICAICNKCLFDANHDMCVIDYVNDVNVHSKSKSKRNKMRKGWKPTGKVFTEIGYSWKPTGRIFTIVGNRCPITRIASTKEVPLKKSTITPVIIPSPKLKVVQIVLKPDLSYLLVFGALCYTTNDGEDLGKLKPKADIGILLTTMASEQFSLGPGPKLMNHGTISSGLVQNITSSTSYVLPTKNDWEILFQPMFDEYLNPPPCVDPQVPAVIAPEPAVSTNTPS